MRDDARMGTEAHTWQIGDELPSHNEDCMVCGSTSASSPLLAPYHVLAGDRVGTRVRFDSAHHQGAPTYAHGGAVAALLDDAMGYMSFLTLRIFVTAHLEVDYRRPVLLDTEYDVAARLERVDGRKLHLAAELRDEDGVAAEANGIFVTVDLSHFRP